MEKIQITYDPHFRDFLDANGWLITKLEVYVEQMVQKHGDIEIIIKKMEE